MADAEEQPDYHLMLEAEEVTVAASALRLLISDEAHEPVIRGLAREVIAGLEGAPDERGRVTLTLTPGQMKITHSADPPAAQRSAARAGRGARDAPGDPREAARRARHEGDPDQTERRGRGESASRRAQERSPKKPVRSARTMKITVAADRDQVVPVVAAGVLWLQGAHEPARRYHPLP